LKKFLKFLVASLVAVFAVSSLSACAAEPMNASDYAAVIDVRTVEEWNSGYLQGAVLIEIADADFRQELSNLDPSADYYIYCRSGNRAGQAINIMRDMGFTGELVNGGSVANASGQLGVQIVKD
jgi:rhodanese-related sulfurtransferase